MRKENRRMLNSIYEREDIRGTFHEVLDYNVVEWRDGHVLMQLEVKPEHRDQEEFIHDGILSSLIDIAGFLGGDWSPNGPGRSVTINLNISFINDSKAETIIAIGKRTQKTNKMQFTKVDILEEDTKKLLATGQCTYKILSPDTKDSPGVSRQ